MSAGQGEQLLPCPCGEQPAHGFQGGYLDEGGYGYVECHKNGFSVVVHAATEAEAIAVWNTRHRSADSELVETLLLEAQALIVAFANGADRDGPQVGRAFAKHLRKAPAYKALSSAGETK